MGDLRQDLHFEIVKSQAQFAYFQLGVAASALAYAVHETAGHKLSDTPWPILGSFLSWALSFFFGCLGETARIRGMRSHAGYLDLVRDLPPASRLEGQAKVEFDKATKTTEADLLRPQNYFRLQLWTLFAGAVLYVAGHVIGMTALDSPAKVAPPAKVEHQPVRQG